ncbi:MAG: hypothetical protein BWX70_02306 [Verrucomicrobia bacterium ADurb.Bin070]|nr:MAG: hypothetical protein BWX70_02306 [Verrucomicrobia bacterium ADurb.Bin070]
MLAEDRLDRLGLHGVVERGRGAVGIHVIDILDAEARVLECGLDGADGTGGLGVRGGQVVGVAGGAVAGEFGIDAGVARFSVRLSLEDQHRGALGHDKAVAACVKRAAGSLGRVVILCAQRLHGAETAHAVLGDGGFGAARDDHVRAARADHVQRHAERVGAGGAGGDHGVRGAFGLQGDGDVAGRLVGDEFGNEHGREAPRAALEERVVALFVDLFAADAVADHHRDAFGIGAAVSETGILPRLLGRSQGILGEEPHAARLFGVDILRDVEILHLARDF